MHSHSHSTWQCQFEVKAFTSFYEYISPCLQKRNQWSTSSYKYLSRKATHEPCTQYQNRTTNRIHTSKPNQSFNVFTFVVEDTHQSPAIKLLNVLYPRVSIGLWSLDVSTLKFSLKNFEKKMEIHRETSQGFIRIPILEQHVNVDLGSADSNAQEQTSVVISFNMINSKLIGPKWLE
jgi:hypothetical protein